MRYGNKDLEMLKLVLSNNQIGTSRSENAITNKFERDFAEAHSVDHAIAVTSGTAGLHLALLACGVKQGDEVLVDPLYRFGAYVTLYCNATPVFYDISLDHYMPTVDTILPRISFRTKALIITNIFGCLTDLEGIRNLCQSHNIVLIEDCAHSIMCHGNEKIAGTYGDIGVFSFHSKKHMSLGEGGMLITNNDVLYNNAEAIHNMGLSSDVPNAYGAKLNLGRVYRMPELVAAVGISQLQNISEVINYHKFVGNMLCQLMPKEIFVPQKSYYSEHVYWWWVARISKPEILNILEKRFGKSLMLQFGINGKKAVYEYELFENTQSMLCPNADVVAKEALCVKITYGKDISEYEDIAYQIIKELELC